jgi:lipopolysaccharide transport system ATP-binding protein
MSRPIIEVENLSKRYKLGQFNAQTMREEVEQLFARLRNRGATSSKLAGESSEFWALKDISFSVQRGEVLGIIGRNGAGKSTLLKILSRITEPTSGTAYIRGRVASLLEVGTGFHPELTGRENIYLNGAILGMTRAEIRRKFDEIVDFSGVEKFIDTPVKRYSSGMYVRLAFAVAAHLEPEILLIDEVLAVGDTEFQRKCLGKVKMIANGGRTVLFVSHNLRSMQQLCSNAILLTNGEVAMAGHVEKCLEFYLNSGVYETDGYIDLAATSINRRGSGECRFDSFELLSLDGKRTARFRFGEPFLVKIVVEADRNIGEVLLGFSFITNMGHEIMGTAAHDGGSRSVIKSGRNQFVCRIDPMILNPGRYLLRAAIFVFDRVFDHIDEVMRFEIEAAVVNAAAAPMNHYVGDVYVPYEWNDGNKFLGQPDSETRSKRILSNRRV